MARFTWDDRTFELVERPLFGEIAWVEKESGRDFQSMSGMEQTMALLLLSLRRGEVMLRWSDMLEASPADFQDLPDELDPTGADEAQDEATPTDV